ncbi:SRPBCC family protein [Streptomyces adelaidensis]|uniref:SRPBCC family protein n=1 Tax=Streptomyces adelaidensis TaxID=2796465 RepID=UPI0027DCCBF1|nr:SRPBCC domain-containing protein [Streptomyces adelaidensis]
MEGGGVDGRGKRRAEGTGGAGVLGDLLDRVEHGLTTVNGENVAEGRFVEVDPPKRPVFTWGWAEGAMPVPPGSSTVEITLEAVPDGTLLRLAHRGLPSPEACAAHKEGWTHHMDRLATVATGDDPGLDDWM